MMHPLFGCIQDDRVMKIPLNTMCQELLPHTKKLSAAALYRAKKDASLLILKLTFNLFKFYDEYPTTAQLKMVLEPEELDDKEIIPTREIHPEKHKQNADYPFMYKQLAVQLSCGSIATKHALNNQWTIEALLNALYNLRNPSEMPMEMEPSALNSVTDINAVEREDDFNDGYYTL